MTSQDNEPPTLIERARKYCDEMEESDGGVSGEVAMIREMADELEDWEQAFDMYWRANQRATALFKAAHPDDPYDLPDQGRMIAWLCDQVEELRARP